MQSTALTLRASHFRKLEPTRLKIIQIYPEYRLKFDKKTNSYIECNFFPSTATKEVIHSGDDSAKSNNPNEVFHLRRKVWDKDNRCFNFTKLTPDEEKAIGYGGKVFDVVFEVESDIKLPKWDSELKKEVDVDVFAHSLISVKALGSYKIQGIAKAMMLSKGIKEVTKKRKDENGDLVEFLDLPNNWEDAVLDKMIGRAFEFSVNGTGLATKYNFAQVSDFKTDELSTNKTYKDEISVDDLPF